MRQHPKCSFCDATCYPGIASFLGGSGVRICEACVDRTMLLLRIEREEVGPHVYVSTSSIHGRGLFAGEDIAEDTYVGTYEGLDDCDYGVDQASFVIFIHEDDDDDPKTWRLGSNEFRFVNHSEDPNLVMDEHYHFWAVRGIEKNEELTWNYGDQFASSLEE